MFKWHHDSKTLERLVSWLAICLWTWFGPWALEVPWMTWDSSWQIWNLTGTFLLRNSSKDTTCDSWLRLMIHIAPIIVLLYQKVGWPSLSLRRHQHQYLFINRGLLHKLPHYLSSLLCLGQYPHDTHSQHWLTLHVPAVKTNLGKTTFRF